MSGNTGSSFQIRSKIAFHPSYFLSSLAMHVQLEFSPTHICRCTGNERCRYTNTRGLFSKGKAMAIAAKKTGDYRYWLVTATALVAIKSMTDY